MKVCGLGALAEVAAAAEAGADAVGFVYFKPSPRHRDLAEIRQLAYASPIKTVLVTVDLDSSTLIDAASRAGVDAVQLHGQHAAVAAAAARRLGLDVIRPISPGQDTSDVHPDDLLLLDTPGGELPGGTGQPFDWSQAKKIDRRFLLAGGLSPDNVARAIDEVQPFGVDASSGLESSPGVKDVDLIRRFVEEAKRA